MRGCKQETGPRGAEPWRRSRRGWDAHKGGMVFGKTRSDRLIPSAASLKVKRVWLEQRSPSSARHVATKAQSGWVAALVAASGTPSTRSRSPIKAATASGEGMDAPGDRP